MALVKSSLAKEKLKINNCLDDSNHCLNNTGNSKWISHKDVYNIPLNEIQNWNYHSVL